MDRSSGPDAAGAADEGIAEDMVREALGRLYDNAALIHHPLLPLLVRRMPDPLARAQQLRRVIVDAIHGLEPPSPVTTGSKEWRPYGVLLYRYVDRMTDERIQRELAVSERQLFRDLRTGIALLTTALRARGGAGDASSTWARGAGGAEALTSTLEGVGLHLERLDLDLLVRQVLPLMAAMAEARGSAIDYRPCPGGMIAVADEALSRQALISAISEALRHGHGRVGLSASTSDEALRLLLDFRAAPAAAEAGDPDAVGLARQLLEQQGGALHCEEGADGSRRLALQWPRFREPVVVVVDDDPGMLRLFERYLGGHGYRAVSTTSGREAVGLARENGARLIVLDVMMRGMDGWTVLQQIRAEPDTAAIPVLVCSVVDEPELALTLGATALLRKPVSREQLLDAVAQIVGI